MPSRGRSRPAVQVHAGKAPDLVLYCAGHYLPQRATAFDLPEMQRHLAVNYGGALHLLDAVLPMLLAAGQGIWPWSDRWPATAGCPCPWPTARPRRRSTTWQRTYLDLHDLGLGVSIINPGFVDTPLTAQNRFSMPALISADEAARHMLHGWAQGRFEMNFPRRFTLDALAALPARRLVFLGRAPLYAGLKCGCFRCPHGSSLRAAWQCGSANLAQQSGATTAGP
jgi:NAD(P)-dependent dehydrogenase (short-subunit alcohol dehydrogenase family)